MSGIRFEVHLGNLARRVGVLDFQTQGARQHSSFRYDEDWIAGSDGFPISPTMPFAQRVFFTSRGVGAHASAFPGAIADTCPDAWGQAILRRDGKARGKELTDVDLLTGVDDFTRIGALRFKLQDGDFMRARKDGRPIAPPLMELDALLRAADAVENRSETAQDLARLLGNGSSLGGARPKCNVLADGRLLIAKFTSKNDTFPIERAEVATLRLARRAGLEVPEVDLRLVGDRPVALIARFDRSMEGRIPYVSAQTMLGLEDATSGTYEALAEAMRAHCRDTAWQLAALFARVAFTILVSNVDDHLKNHGFLHVAAGQWRLSPIFDVNPSPERERSLKTRIAEDTGDEASIDTLLSKAAIFGLTASVADQMVSGMAEVVRDCWRDEAEKAGMSAKEIAVYKDAFVHGEVEIALARAFARVQAGGAQTPKDAAVRASKRSSTTRRITKIKALGERESR